MSLGYRLIAQNLDQIDLFSFCFNFSKKYSVLYTVTLFLNHQIQYVITICKLLIEKYLVLKGPCQNLTNSSLMAGLIYFSLVVLES